METLIWLHDEGFQQVFVKLDWKAVVDNFNGHVFDVIESKL